LNMLVDVHCHLDFKDFDGDRDAVVGRAADMLIVNSCVEASSVQKALTLCKSYHNVRCMLGFSASETDEDAFNLMRSIIKEHRDDIVGMGEVGLDYHWVKDEAGRESERRHFIDLVGLSRELGLPLLVHSRDAESDTINILGERKVSAIMHCFSGTTEEAKRAVEAGCLISIPANVAYSKGRQNLVRSLPIDSMVLETDAPYLSPRRGERNEPANVKVAAEWVAQLKGLSLSEVEETTSRNAMGFLGMKNG
jgi:TatD DNase family protein